MIQYLFICAMNVQAEFLLEQACQHLAPFGSRAENLVGVAHFMIKNPLEAIANSATYTASAPLVGAAVIG